MNVNFGLFPPIEGNYRGKERKQAMAARALRDFDVAGAGCRRSVVSPDTVILRRHRPRPLMVMSGRDARDPEATKSAPMDMIAA